MSDFSHMQRTTDIKVGDRVRSIVDRCDDHPGSVGTVVRVNTFDAVRITVEWDDRSNCKVAPFEIEKI